jgi:hypothetical protein
MRAGEWRSSNGQRYRSRTLAMRALARQIDNTLGLRLRDLAGKRVVVGLPEGSDPYPQTGEDVIDVAFQNEFGTETIPARPFLRTTIRNNLPSYFDLIEADMGKVLDGTLPAASIWPRVGERMAGDVRMAIEEWTTPPNAPATQIEKGKKASSAVRASATQHIPGSKNIGATVDPAGVVMLNNPLVDTGHLGQTIRHVVEEVNSN